MVKRAAASGNLSIFCGAGVNFAQSLGGPRNYQGKQSPFLPTGAELAVHIGVQCQHDETLDYLKRKTFAQNGNPTATCCQLLGSTPAPDIAKVCQFARSTGYPLDFELHEIFGQSYPTTSLHQKLAMLPALAPDDRKPIFITTNYDSVIEEALASAHQPFDIVYYRPPGPGTPVWLYHWPNAHQYFSSPQPRLTPVPHDIPIADLATYNDLPVTAMKSADGVSKEKARTIVVKIHGTVSPKDYGESSFVIAQNDYIRFLRLISPERILPTRLQERLENSHFLFLGYGLADWNVMAICQNLWDRRKTNNYQNWAIQWQPTKAEADRWSEESAGKVILYDQDLTAYAQQL